MTHNPWKTPINQLNRMQRLWQRQQILAAIREDFYAEHFLEVETPLLVKGTTPEVYIDSVAAGDGFLITSTEYQLKRLMSEGFTRLFTLTKNFRANDCGRYHSEEFTMLEWGSVNKSLQNIEEDAIRFIRKAFRILYSEENTLLFNGNEINFMEGDWERLTVREAFGIHLNLHDLGDFSLKCLCKAASEAGLFLPPDFEKDQALLISYLLDTLQHQLGKQKPTFLHEWPAYLTSSAPSSSRDPHAAERSELYIGGIEIANGFPFLRNAAIQEELFEIQQHQRIALGKPIMPLDHKYLDALKKLPQGAGMALGVDRLVMILTQASKLADVQAFAWDEL